MVNFQVNLIMLSFEAGTQVILGLCPNDFLGMSLNDTTILFIVILFYVTVSVG